MPIRHLRKFLEHIVRLAASEVTGGGAQPLTIVLTADAHQLSHVPRRLLELAELRIDIEPWEPLDTAQYVAAALNQAGRAAPLFTDPALDRLHDLCEGVPRRVNQLANLALLAGAGSQLNEIDADMIESVYRELAVVEAVA